MVAATGTEFFDYLEHGPPAAGGSVPRRDGSRSDDAGGRAEPRPRLGRRPAGLRRRRRHRRRAADAGPRLRPDLDPLLFDRPEVVAAAPADLPAVGGDFFVSVPGGCDRYLLLAIVHDWDDADAVRLLRRVRDALPEHGAAVVVENVLPDRPRDEFAVASDLLMLVLGPGRERTRARVRGAVRRPPGSRWRATSCCRPGSARSCSFAIAEGGRGDGRWSASSLGGVARVEAAGARHHVGGPAADAVGLLARHRLAGRPRRASRRGRRSTPRPAAATRTSRSTRASPARYSSRGRARRRAVSPASPGRSCRCPPPARRAGRGRR